jgi:hypothetical protein
VDISLRVRRVRRTAFGDTGFHSQACVICHVTCKGRSLKSLPFSGNLLSEPPLALRRLPLSKIGAGLLSRSSMTDMG